MLLTDTSFMQRSSCNIFDNIVGFTLINLNHFTKIILIFLRIFASPIISEATSETKPVYLACFEALFWKRSRRKKAIFCKNCLNSLPPQKRVGYFYHALNFIPKIEIFPVSSGFNTAIGSLLCARSLKNA